MKLLFNRARCSGLKDLNCGNLASCNHKKKHVYNAIDQQFEKAVMIIGAIMKSCIFHCPSMGNEVARL
jgi:hypothetical protein